MKRPRIAIVVTFFGPPPLWFPAFLLSCRANPDVQWLLYTDIDAAVELPPNVTVKRTSLAELSRRASDVLGTAIDLQRAPRKLCDLKPAYGVVFADDLQPFDFWACSDLDIIWGDIWRFLPNALLEAHDVVSSRPSRLSGHFTLFRNTPATNRLFQLIPDFAQAMTTTHYEHLDERELTRHLRDYMASAPPGAAPRVYWRQELTISSEYQRGLDDGDALSWRDGKTFNADGRELMYLHFHKMKQQMQAIDFALDDAPPAFAITRSGFSARRGPVRAPGPLQTA